MGILFAISLLALAALLWASLSIARHIRHERHGHARTAFGDSAVTDVAATSSEAAFPADELTFSELSPYGPTVVSRTRITHAPPPPIPGHAPPPPLPSESVPADAQDWDWTTPRQIAQEASPLPPPLKQPAANPIDQEILPPSVVDPAIETAPTETASYEPALAVEPLASTPEQEAPAAALPMETFPSVRAAEERDAHAEAEAQAAIQAQIQADLAHGQEAHGPEAASDELHGQEPQANFDPLPSRFKPSSDKPLTGTSEPTVPAPDPAAESTLPRATATLLSMTPRPPAAPLAAPLKNRLDWTYFNKDMGDLSDPLPSHSRLRHRRG